MLASMSDVEPLNWSDPGVTEFVPTGTVTLLLADVEGSTWLWQTQPEQMTAAVAQLDRSLAGLVTAHHGVRPVEQGEGDSFVVAFTRASDAVACALALRRTGCASGSRSARRPAARGTHRRCPCLRPASGQPVSA